MMRSHYLYCAVDRAGSLTLRQELRESHRAALRRPDPRCRCVLGGPLLDVEGTMTGTALVFEAEHPDAVAAFMADDPYVVGGLFETVEIRPWRLGLGAIA